MTIHQPELLEKILIHLPAKSIGRFRCVSKAWKSLLSQPHFIKSHLNRINQYPIQEQSFILDCDKFLYSIKLESAHQVFDEIMTPTMLNLGDHRFSASSLFRETSCDGLIVVEDVHGKLMLINPTTREIKALPEGPELPRDIIHRYRKSNFPGIGYDSHNDDYKVVTISFYYNHSRPKYDDKMLVNMYSVKNGTWKTVADENAFGHVVSPKSGGVYTNDHIHWIAMNKITRFNVILAFDLKEEMFRQVPHPSSIDDLILMFGCLLIVQGCLCFSPDWANDHNHECFMMKEYGVKESWTTEFTIPDHGTYLLKFLCLLGEEQMVLLLNSGPGQRLELYSVKERTLKEIKIRRFQGTFVLKRRPLWRVYSHLILFTEMKLPLRNDSISLPRSYVLEFLLNFMF